MVDRITPGTGDRERILARELFDIEDAWPVFCEDFKQWVVEDHFPVGRPASETVGAQFVTDVAPYEHMKLRILNGGHATIAYPAGLLDIHFVHEAMAAPAGQRLPCDAGAREIIPAVPPVPDTDLEAYCQLIERRFANPKIGDTIRAALPRRLQPPAQVHHPYRADRLRQGRPVDGLALESALWCRYCFGKTESGKEIAPNDPAWDRLQGATKPARKDPYSLARDGRHFWRPRDKPDLCRRFLLCALVSMVEGRPRDARRLSRRNPPERHETRDQRPQRLRAIERVHAELTGTIAMYLERFNLKGRVAVVTGGAQGIGLACVEALAEAGAHVYIADLDMKVGGASARRHESKRATRPTSSRLT